MNDLSSTALEKILRQALGQKALPPIVTADTPLLGGVAGFDSLAILAILTGIQKECGLVIPEHEISADVFESVGSLQRFVQARLDEQGR